MWYIFVNTFLYYIVTIFVKYKRSLSFQFMKRFKCRLLIKIYFYFIYCQLVSKKMIWLHYFLPVTMEIHKKTHATKIRWYSMSVYTVNYCVAYLLHIARLLNQYTILSILEQNNMYSNTITRIIQIYNILKHGNVQIILFLVNFKKNVSFLYIHLYPTFTNVLNMFVPSTRKHIIMQGSLLGNLCGLKCIVWINIYI